MHEFDSGKKGFVNHWMANIWNSNAKWESVNTISGDKNNSLKHLWILAKKRNSDENILNVQRMHQMWERKMWNYKNALLFHDFLEWLESVGLDRLLLFHVNKTKWMFKVLPDEKKCENSLIHKFLFVRN